jgi:hypothetical protein
MGKSDAHAAKCAKLGVKFSDEYPDELKEYEAANAEYNSNEEVISTFIIVCFIGSLLFGYGFGLGAGFAAEYKDKAWGGTFDWWDIAADLTGTIIGGICHYLIFKCIRRILFIR